MLFTLTKSIDAIASAQSTNTYEAVEASQPQQLQLLLDLVYAGRAAPAHRTLIDGIAAMTIHALRSRIPFTKVHRERSLAALIVAIAGHHDLEITLRPLLDAEIQLCRFADDRSTSARHVATWLRHHVTAGDPDMPVRMPSRDQPLRGCGVAIHRAVTPQVTVNPRRDDYMTDALTRAITALGGQVLTPLPRRIGDGEGDRTNDQVLTSAVRRLGRAAVGIGLIDSGSFGVATEVNLGAQLGLTMLAVQQGNFRSPWLRDDRVTVLTHNDVLGRIPGRVTDWLTQNSWRWHNSLRRAEDRDVVHARERTRLATAWDQLTSPQQDAMCETLDIGRDRILMALGSAAGLEAIGTGEVDRIAAALGHHRGPAIEAPFQYDQHELEVLASVCKERRLEVTEGFLAAMDLLVELSSSSERRGRLHDRDLWHQYFDAVGLDNR